MVRGLAADTIVKIIITLVMALVSSSFTDPLFAHMGRRTMDCSLQYAPSGVVIIITDLTDVIIGKA